MSIRLLSLSKNEDFKSLLNGKKISNKYLTIFFKSLSGKSNKYLTIFFKKLSNKNNKNLNISFVTQKKIGNAVKRNKIKRRLRNIMNDAFKKISIKLSYSYLVIAKPTMLNNEFNNIKETLFQEFERIR